MRKPLILFLVVMGLFYTQSVLAQENSAPSPTIPERVGYLNDQAQVLKPAEAQQLEASLQQIQKQVGTGIYILLVNSTKPMDIVAYTHQVADAWGLKVDSTQDKWVFIVVAVKDTGTNIDITDSQAVRALVPDAALGQILEGKLKPAFNAGKFAQGLAGAIQEIVHQLVLAVPQGYGTSSPDDPARYRAELAVLGLVVVLAVVLYFVVVRHH